MTVDIGPNLKDILELVVLTIGFLCAYLGWLKS